MQQWEYAVLTMDAGGTMFWVGFSAPIAVETSDYPLRDCGVVLGELGAKGWELVRVAQSANRTGGRDEKLSFKRPHEMERDLRSEEGGPPDVAGQPPRRPGLLRIDADEAPAEVVKMSPSPACW